MRDYVHVLTEGVQQDQEDCSSAVVEQRSEIVCWMIERNFYFLFVREHSAADEQSLAAELRRAALAIMDSN